ncbi:hypothetical protein BJ508DRAFT_324441 [Ascobolus immersus RN42]|uniref:Uncharacterized protein n=1 Tax=Ascobolus immersus RN42 TaxID=1160509 RepID=A0A3N4IHR9_ASCIM|nr:hypothetical protein BJ508DRAFT_324441 [Ascobolus immersus RN42]
MPVQYITFTTAPQILAAATTTMILHLPPSLLHVAFVLLTIIPNANPTTVYPTLEPRVIKTGIKPPYPLAALFAPQAIKPPALTIKGSNSTLNGTTSSTPAHTAEIGKLKLAVDPKDLNVYIIIIVLTTGMGHFYLYIHRWENRLERTLRRRKAIEEADLLEDMKEAEEAKRKKLEAKVLTEGEKVPLADWEIEMQLKDRGRLAVFVSRCVFVEI